MNTVMVAPFLRWGGQFEQKGGQQPDARADGGGEQDQRERRAVAAGDRGAQRLGQRTNRLQRMDQLVNLAHAAGST
ncbi:hypothetical protein AB0K48_37855, partial [Nonomuraea sp. NPDC055795]